MGINLFRSLPADTIFNEKYLQDADAVLGMYHDQVLPVLKYKGFGRSVNITLGYRLFAHQSTTVFVFRLGCASLVL